MYLNQNEYRRHKVRLSPQLLFFMRVSFVFSTLICMHLALWANAQNTLSIAVKKESLKDVFELIERQSDYRFLYHDNPVFQNKKITLRIEEGSLDKVMKNLLEGTGLAYKVNNSNLVILSFAPAGDNIEQTVLKPVTGSVTDEKGSPLNGVSVTVKGTNKGTSTNSSGSFSIDAKQGDVLEFSFVGYKAVALTVGKEENISMKMLTDVSGLGEVVVVGYGTQTKTKVTGAVTTVKMDEILGDRPVSTVSSLLQSVVPGLQVTIASGQPGTSASFNIRGATDLNTSGASINTGGPLILVDNVPFNGALNLLDPNDIETVTTLKDAGSAAIYGGRSAFGVILITTKKGKKNQKAQFEYSNNIIFASATNLPQKATPLQFLQSLKDMGTVAYWSGQNVDTWIQLVNDFNANPSKYPGSIAAVGNARYPLAPYDVMKDLLGSHSTQIQNNFNVSGGSDKTIYRFSLGTVNENGIIVPSTHLDKFTRYNVKSFLSSDVSSWLTAQVDAGYSNSLNSAPYSNQFADAVNFPILTPSDYFLTSGTGITDVSGIPKNKVVNGGYATAQNSDIRLTGRSILKPVKGLTITGEYTYDNLKNNQTSYDKLVNYVNASNFGYGPVGSGTYSLINGTTVYKALNIFGNYVKSYKGHNFSLLAGYNWEDNAFRQNTTSRNGMIASNLPSISQGTGPINASDSYSSYSLQGYFGRLNYDYKGKYLFQVNGRYDGSSNFPENHRFGFFPSGSVGWRMSEENFMQRFKPVLSELKLRASLGTVGNQNINPYSFIAVLNSAQPLWLNGTGAYLTSLTTPGLISSSFTWEKVQTIDYGVDFGFLSNRLNGSFDWYKRDTKNILAAGAVPLPGVLGTGAPLQNTASLTSKGFEISLNWNDRVGSNIKYRIGVNLYDYQARITKFDGNPTNLLNTYYVGQKVGEIYGYTTDRLYTVDDFVAGTLTSNLTGGTLKPGITKLQGENPNPGDVLYKDLNKDGIVAPGVATKDDSGDRSIIGNNSLRYQYGIYGGVSYKNIDFSFVLGGVGKQDIFPVSPLTFPNQYSFGTIYQNELDYWTPTNPNAHYGRIYDQGNGNQGFNQNTQTRFLLNGAYLRVRNLGLSYSLPTPLIKKVRLNAFRLFYSVENPFTFSHVPKGLDPSLSDLGYGLGYPFLRKHSFGVNLSF